jgi:hypothetical protein
VSSPDDDDAAAEEQAPTHCPAMTGISWVMVAT